MIKKPKKMTTRSGVYLFKNKLEEVVYIGKAKNISQRIQSYFNKDIDLKTNLLLKEAVAIETIPTQTELEALYLETHLIKTYKPKFNILLKDGNPFLYLFFSNEKIPTMQLVKTKKKKGIYIGPFLSKKAIRSVYHFILTTFQLKRCKSKIEQGCLAYHIGVCAGNCKKDFEVDFYKRKIELVKKILLYDIKELYIYLDKSIQELSAQLLFEQAQQIAMYKKNLDSILHTVKELSMMMPTKQAQEPIDQNLSLLMSIQKRLYLKHVPYVIDCFDVSHMQGKAIVGACIRYVHGVPEKKAFRRFLISSLKDQNDYAALQEIVQRRYKDGKNVAHLIIVDGGKGQMNAIRPYIYEAELVGLAKSEETIISSDFKHFIKLNPKNVVDALLLQIRDYAHHFALSYHRKKRSL
ncbi:GIY-YIG nuclease family protein [Candidatus Dependentiae bacterium]|nr:GIY-YIG nuclease family protein [Candidatus Dependentiae bacterium]